MSHFIAPIGDDDTIMGIKRVSNGFEIQISEGEDENGNIKISEMVIQEKDNIIDDMDDLEAAQNLLYQVLETFGYHYSKHNKRNIEIKIKKNREID